MNQTLKLEVGVSVHLTGVIVVGKRSELLTLPALPNIQNERFWDIV